MYRRIGSTTYKVTVHFDEAEQETMTDKIVRLIGNEAITGACYVAGPLLSCRFQSL